MRSGGDDPAAVVCLACGERVAREDAREYDRFGDRWDRTDKRFEYLCKPCHHRECHLPRRGLEAALATVGTRHPTPAAFVAAYYRHVRTRSERTDA